ncbi:glutaredoxin family protein [Streptacidiphilus fuscans]|uniref:Glutaredoxin family protein n=1 Tax=Streptacidiphilus fuscans TaxID=2789292 RepID=A0A931FG32_9ACTN|nr:glutaredoxin family protein [Streptacidiphilus fuscans]MBF9073487.1 glutaredoxin family protein [Streptacidiphilus fuscans]
MAPLLPRRSTKQPADHVVTLIGKPDCHLCEDAEAVIDALATELGFAVEKLSINDDKELFRRYWEQIPVTLVDGKQHDFWKVDPKRLRTALGA